MPTCLIVQPIHEAGVQKLEEAGIATRWASAQDMATVAAEIGEADAVITRDAGLDRAAIDAAGKLAVIANHGIGTNKIDVAHASALDIPIVYTPSANARSVAEHAIGMMLALAKRFKAADAATHAGDWRFKYSGGMSEISGKTLGLVGFGTIAKIVAAMAIGDNGVKIYNRELAKAAKLIHPFFLAGDWDTAVHEACIDLAVGTAALLPINMPARLLRI